MSSLGSSSEDEQIETKNGKTTGALLILVNSDNSQDEVQMQSEFAYIENEILPLVVNALDLKKRIKNNEIGVKPGTSQTKPVGQNEIQFNAPTIEEVAIVLVGEEFESRDIILHRKSGDVQRVSESHRSYDGLQYPILFWRGEGGYHFNIKMRNPQTDEETNKKIGAMSFVSTDNSSRR
ncbi:hypothetical protein EVAR_38258_1 [Eumeta japonica]|uniref:Uncharacterized protein n=1 Tax=Eumeta variegata TaxID=151549 RepID=A0A4C1YC61_EUMVA|nr:hypothetical protein EVAR_38258_1 [Eumeta japonica]